MLLDMIAELEVCNLLYKHGNKYADFCQNDNEGLLLSAKKLKNPLLLHSTAIDFEIREEANVCILGGANGSGKSSLIRAISMSYLISLLGGTINCE